MSYDDLDGDIRDIVKDKVKRELETEEGSVFSRTEVMRRLRSRIDWKGTGEADNLAEMHRSGQMDRRRFLKMLGLGAGGALVATSGAGYFFGTKIFDEKGIGPTGMATNVSDTTIQNAPGNNVVNASSLQEAADNFNDGNTVVLAEGTYDWNDDIAGDIWGGDKSNCSLIGDGNVVLERDKRDYIRSTLTATDGTVRVQNFTLRGKRGIAQSRTRLDSEDGATLNWVNINMPDGTMECTDSTGIYVGDSNSGTINCINCSWQMFGNSACYVRYSPSPVNFDSCFYKNCGSGGIRLFTGGEMVVQRIVGVVDADYIPGFQEAAEPGADPSCDGNSGRTLKCEEGSGIVRDSDFVIEDVDGAAPCLDIQDDQESSGTFRDIRIRNESSEAPISDSGGYADNWTAENICIIGSGSKDVPSSWEDAVNSDCTSVQSTPPTNSNWSNTTSTTSGTTTTGTTTSGGTGVTVPATGPITFTITGESGQNSTYLFTSQGEITAQNSEGTDEVLGNKASGIVNGESDTYTVNAPITEFYAESGITITYNGTEINPQEFRNSNACI